MRVLILGIDGYIGWSLAVHLAYRKGFEVFGLDSLHRRLWVASVGSHSATPISSMPDRVKWIKESWGQKIEWRKRSLQDDTDVYATLSGYQPDAIVHLAEQSSAPYSMKGLGEAVHTQQNNVLGTLNLLHAMHDICPDAHLVKLGSMGEYGTPNWTIPEGNCVKQAGSWYHLSKVHDSANIEFACKQWGLTSTDIMQGPVHGVKIDKMGDAEELLTRFDFDPYFGTVLNRFCAQAIAGVPLTIYAGGQQKRGFITLQDSINCLTLILENPPKAGKYRVVNQFEDVYSIRSLANMVADEASKQGVKAGLAFCGNPRREAEEHRYTPDHNILPALGYKPAWPLHMEVATTLQVLSRYKDRILEKQHLLVEHPEW